MTTLEDVDTKRVWSLIDAHFRDLPQTLVQHHIDSFNDFISTGMAQILRETNPLKIDLEYNSDTNSFGSSAKLYFGGKDGANVFFGKPVIVDADGNTHFLFPNEARLRNMTYQSPVFCDVDIEIERVIDGFNQDGSTNTEGDSGIGGATPVDEHGMKTTFDPSTPRTAQEIANVVKSIAPRTFTKGKQTGVEMVQRFKMPPLRKFIYNLPIMVQSDLCVLTGLDRNARFALGECRNDIGAYFIIGGKEKTGVGQEAFADNMICVKKNAPADTYSVSAKIRSVSENVSKPMRTLAVHLANPSGKYTNRHIVVDVPNIRKPVPLFILFRALGILSDKDIIAYCTLTDPDTMSPEVVQWFLPSIHDAGQVWSQADALQYLSVLIKGRTVVRVLHVLADYFLPHVGEMNFSDKAYFLGHLVNELRLVDINTVLPTDRDKYKFKRIEPVGVMLRDLVREYFILWSKQLRRGFETKYEFNKASFADVSDLVDLTHDIVFDQFGKDIVNIGIKKAFKGNWGGSANTKRVGVIQDLNRLSFLGYISHLRKINLPLDPSVKLIGPRILHGSQWGIIDPIDTPDGGNIGIHKALSMFTYITRGHSRDTILAWFNKRAEVFKLMPLAGSDPVELGLRTKIMVNGFWAGSVEEPLLAVDMLREDRRCGLIPASTSIAFDIPSNTVVVCNDKGRVCAPAFYRDSKTKKFSYEQGDWPKMLSSYNRDTSNWTWMDAVSGYTPKKVAGYNMMKDAVYDWDTLYSEPRPVNSGSGKALVEYLDKGESEYTMVAFDEDTLRNTDPREAARFTHRDIDPSLGYGVMCNLINYLEHNPVVRNSFSCGQAKQACSDYHTNHRMRMDKTAIVLDAGQVPLVKTRFHKYICNEENANGVNAIVAILAYSAYNVEDAILINEGSLHRGIFRTTYYSTYEAHEESTTKGDATFLKSFVNIDQLIADNAVVGMKPEYDYSNLDDNGVIRENTQVTEKTALIGIASGMVSYAPTGVGGNAGAAVGDKRSMVMAAVRRDESKTPKKGQLGVVDKVFMTEGEEGERIAKVRLREERIPTMGDKFASRAGQKGTIGMVVKPENMPFCANGETVDLCVNPHALPSRMTIGQLIETLAGKACAHFGSYADCTPFADRKRNAIAYFGMLLNKIGQHSSGNEIMYSGFNGEQLVGDVFKGPTYYMRLKHMTKDKINFRGKGPNEVLTRQPVQGRANDGGLRVGEMERDTFLAHGISDFLRESMMERSDAHELAICNTTGTIAVYNPAQNLMYSLAADGPVTYAQDVVSDDKDASRHERGGAQLQQITKYGRSFSIVQVPYALKLLIQELQALNVRMALITEDNVSQVTNASGSNNMEAILAANGLTGKGTIAEKIVAAIKSSLHARNGKRSAEAVREEAHRDARRDVRNASRAADREVSEPVVAAAPRKRGGEGGGNGGENGAFALWDGELSLDGTEVPHTGGAPPAREGDVVHYRGDSIPHRQWSVSHVGTRGDVTIHTMDARDLSTADTIRIVTQADLLRPTPGNLYAVSQAVHEDATWDLPSSIPTGEDEGGEGDPANKFYNVHGDEIDLDKLIEGMDGGSMGGLGVDGGGSMGAWGGAPSPISVNVYNQTPANTEIGGSGLPTMPAVTMSPGAGPIAIPLPAGLSNGGGRGNQGGTRSGQQRSAADSPMVAASGSGSGSGGFDSGNFVVVKHRS